MKRHRVRSSLPGWRKRQIDEASAKREQRTQQRVGVLMGFEPSEDAPLLAPPRPRLTKRRSAQIAWLRLRPEMWRSLPSDPAAPLSSSQSADLLAIVLFMVDDRLFKPGTLEEHRSTVRAALTYLRGGEA